MSQPHLTTLPIELQLLIADQLDHASKYLLHLTNHHFRTLLTFPTIQISKKDSLPISCSYDYKLYTWCPTCRMLLPKSSFKCKTWRQREMIARDKEQLKRWRRWTCQACGTERRLLASEFNDLESQEKWRKWKANPNRDWDEPWLDFDRASY